MPLAERLGVTDWTRTKWKQRGAIPARWHLPLIVESGGMLSASDFMKPRPAPSPSQETGKGNGP